jgi:hypothetical protein
MNIFSWTINIDIGQIKFGRPRPRELQKSTNKKKVPFGTFISDILH